MVYLLEKIGSFRCTLEATQKDAFTRKPFADMIRDAHLKQNDYYLARVLCESMNVDTEEKNPSYYCYDARQLCKYIFEMVISTEGRKIRIKNFKDPIKQHPIKEIGFFKIRYDSDTPLRAEYVGNQVNFLENNCFRSKIFYQEDALDALSVNFEFNMVQKIPTFDKKRAFSIFIMIVIVLLIGTLLIMFAEKNENRGRPDFNHKFKTK